MNISIETDRLILRIPDMPDTDAILRFVSDNSERFAAYEYAYPEKYFTAEFQQMLIAAVRQQFLRLQGFRYYLYEKEDSSRIIGCVGLANVRAGEDKTASLYYKLDKDYTGRGYALEACRALISAAKSSLDMHRLECDIHPTNEPSLRLVERLSFTREGIAYKSHRIQGKWEDHLRYALILE